MYLPHKTTKLTSLILFSCFLLLSITSFAQISNSLPCYAIGKNATQQDVVFTYDKPSNSWLEKVRTENTAIEALTCNPVTKALYAVSGNLFGFINPQDGKFSPIADYSLTVSGELGNLTINSVKAMNFDPSQQQIYAVQQQADQTCILFKLNPLTGEIIQNSFKSSDGNAQVDYLLLDKPEMSQKTYHNLIAIAVHPFNGQLYALYEQNEDFCLAVSDKLNGNVLAGLLEITDKTVDNLAFTNAGELYAIAKEQNNNASSIYMINPFTQTVEQVSQIAQNISVGCMDCEKAFHDLALKIELSPSQLLPVQPGHEIVFDIEVINQGEVSTKYIQIVNYLSDDLTLIEENGWIFNSQFTLLDVSEELLPGESLTRQIKFVSDQSFEGTIYNFAEIGFYINDYNDQGLSMIWQDVDSYADNSNNELIYIDNEVSQNGLMKNEDEDDHDIVTVSINQSCVPQWLIQNNNDIAAQVYQAGDNIYADNSIVNNTTAFKAGREVTVNNGFQVNKTADFEIQITPCE